MPVDVKIVSKERKGSCTNCGGSVYLRVWTFRDEKDAPTQQTERLFHFAGDTALCFPLCVAEVE